MTRSGQARRVAGALLAGVLLATLAVNAWAINNPRRRPGPVKPEYRTDAVAFQTENRTHDVGNLWITITNWGYFGNVSPSNSSALLDPCTNDWSVQAEFPGGSGIEYLFRAGLWIGAMIQEEGFLFPRVSTGTEGWAGDEEFLPGPEPDNGIIERSTRQNYFNCLGEFVTSPEAISEQDFIAVYTDTSRVGANQRPYDDPIDGPHIPLGIKVTQKSYAWSFNYAQDFIIIDYEIENIADNFLRDVYVGLYVDADVGAIEETDRYTDDICGFQEYYMVPPPPGSVNQDSIRLTINTAYIADNDGRPTNISSGSDFSAPGVTGTRVVRAPNPRLRTSFNWWISNGNSALDFGPAWRDDGSLGDWTTNLGTPEGDSRKYFVLSNREFDFDQIYTNQEEWIRGHPQKIYNRITGELLEEHEWKLASPDNADDLANGFDTRYLISWGPLGVFDFIDQQGNPVYRLNPGEKFSMTIAYVAGDNFHDRNNPQTTNQVIDPGKFNFADLQWNADWAAKVYDNPMYDTPVDPVTGLSDPVNGITDGWFGEDVGIDCVYAEQVGDTVRFMDIRDQVEFVRVYTGPDPDGSERNGRLDIITMDNGEKFSPEDLAPRPQQFDYTYNNELFDHGDGYPDFRGPPPPPSPVVTFRSEGNRLILRWTKFPSEDPELGWDPFSRIVDFEGYRVYVSNTGLESEFSFLAEFDREDWSYYSPNDSLMDSVYTDITDMPQTREFRGITGTLKPVGENLGLPAMVNDSTYEYIIENTNPMVPRYYSVTAFDYGDWRSGTEPLESSKAASMIYVAPSGDPRKKPGVVPNPYRANEDYTRRYLQLVFEADTTSVSWENRDDGTAEFYPQTDRRIYFYNLPRKCLIRIFTVSGDLVEILEHDADRLTGRLSKWNAPFAEPWDLNSRNKQQIVSGLYLFSVEDQTEENKGHIDVGKFVIIR